MTVRFIIGRAGSGKTHHCLREIRTRLRENPVDGPRLILLVPEQASMQMERAILAPTEPPPASAHGKNIERGPTAAPASPGRSQDTAPPPPASGSTFPAAHRVEVLSFQRLAYRVLEAVGRPQARALSEPARAMVVRHLLAKHSDRLRYYGRISRPGGTMAGVGGLVERLSATLPELIQEAIPPEALLKTDAGAADAPPAPDPVHAAKLHDLHLLYSAYLAYLAAGDRLDPSQHLEIARELLPQCDWIKGADLWVDGFASMSGQETETLIKLARRCRQTEISVLLDPALLERASSRKPTDSVRTAARLFNRTLQTFQDLSDRLVEAGLAVGDPLILSPAAPPRFNRNASLAVLERRWWTDGITPATPPVDDNMPAERIELAELPSRRIEVDYAVSQICRWVQDPTIGYRYRDVALIVRDLEPYHDLLSAALTDRRIPFFIDRRRPIAHHPFVELLRAGTAMALEDMSVRSVTAALKTGLLPLSSTAADELENYLLATGIAGVDAWRGQDWTDQPRRSLRRKDQAPSEQTGRRVESVNRTRRAVVEVLDAWLSFAADPTGHTGREWASALADWLATLHVGRTLQTWAQHDEAAGNLEQADAHEQVWAQVTGLLEDVAFAFAETTLSARDLADVLEAGLSGLTLGLVPPTVDQVLVGSIERSRHPDIKAAVILGFNDGVFPARVSEDPILNDDDRERLAEAGVRVREGTRRRILDEAMLVYIALTRPSDALTVTWAAADDAGNALAPSPYLGPLKAACPQLTEKKVEDPGRTRDTWDILSVKDLMRRMTAEMRQRPPLAQEKRQDTLQIRALWNELYDATRAELTNDPAARHAFSSLADPPRARLAPQTVQRLFPGTLETSVSHLETYAQCPFQCFARYVLRLEERPEVPLQPTDIGEYYHAILDDFVATVNSQGADLATITPDAVIDGLAESCRRVAQRLPETRAFSNARNAYLMRRSASQLARVLHAQKKAAGGGRTRTKATEVPFGMDVPNSLPALELRTPKDRTVRLRGFIDRVDLAEHIDEIVGVVVDYKSGREQTLNLSKVYHGISLQLPAYMLALAEVGQTLAGRPIRPIAALYVGLASKYKPVPHPSMATDDHDGQPRARGLIDFEDFNLLDESGAQGGRSPLYSVFTTKEGRIGHRDRSDAAERASFKAVLEHTRRTMARLADESIGGNVAVEPVRLGSFSPCGWCPMLSVCRFEIGCSDVRYLSAFNKSKVFEHIRDPEQ